MAANWGPAFLPFLVFWPVYWLRSCLPHGGPETFSFPPRHRTYNNIMAFYLWKKVPIDEKLKVYCTGSEIPMDDRTDLSFWPEDLQERRVAIWGQDFRVNSPSPVHPAFPSLGCLLMCCFISHRHRHQHGDPYFAAMAPVAIGWPSGAGLTQLVCAAVILAHISGITFHDF